MALFKFSKAGGDYAVINKSADAKDVLGGKGASLVLMSQKGLPVPPGFTISCDVSRAYLKESAAGRSILMNSLMAEVWGGMDWLFKLTGYAPLVSVRSGAPVSMPGMMDTILNVGLTSKNRPDWDARIGHRAAVDSQRRLIQMLGETGYGVPKEVFEFQLAKIKKAAGVSLDTDLTIARLEDLTVAYVDAFEKNKGFAFPLNDTSSQLRAAIEAVFLSWQSERAIEYRKLNGISDDMGTAVTVQAMVFGNTGDDSGSGVLFTRDPSTGAKLIMGEYLANAQGEDVVAGIRTPMTLKAVSEAAHEYGEPPNWLGELGDICAKLEGFYQDMVDVEFTVQHGELFILQSRVGKRSAAAALKIALDMFDEKVITQAGVFKRVTRAQYKVLSRPSIDPAFKDAPHIVGIPAGPGVATGRPVYSSADAVKATDPVILVTEETSPDDIAGMAKAAGILTQNGGATSHAAVVARAMDKACVVGALKLNLTKLKFINPTRITIDGSTGHVWVETPVPLVDASETPEVLRLTAMAFAKKKIGDVITDIEGGSLQDTMLIDLARWQGDYEALDTVITNLVDAKCDGITLSVVPASFYRPEADELLSSAFGPAKPDSFFSDALRLLVENAGALEGLTVRTLPGASTAKLVKAGLKVQVLTPKDLKDIGSSFAPAEYAVFACLAG